MLDEVVAHGTYWVTEAVAPTGDNSTVQVALIGAVSLVMSALIAGYFGTRGDRRDSGETEADWEVAHAEDERRDAEREAARWHARYEVLAIALWRRRLDPNRFQTGQETDDEARF